MSKEFLIVFFKIDYHVVRLFCPCLSATYHCSGEALEANFCLLKVNFMYKLPKLACQVKAGNWI